MFIWGTPYRNRKAEATKLLKSAAGIHDMRRGTRMNGRGRSWPSALSVNNEHEFESVTVQNPPMNRGNRGSTDPVRRPRVVE